MTIFLRGGGAKLFSSPARQIRESSKMKPCKLSFRSSNIGHIFLLFDAVESENLPTSLNNTQKSGFFPVVWVSFLAVS